MPGKKEDKRKLYFLGIVIPQPYFDEAVRLKHYFKDQYNSKAALKSPPHITLHMPFTWNEEKEKQLITQLETFVRSKKPFQLSFNHFGCFKPRVIFLDIKKSNEIENLQRELHRFCKLELNLFNANYKALPFHPHVTVAFRDLKKTDFGKAWEEFSEKKFEGEFIVTDFVLLKHTGKIWEIHQRFQFSD